MSDVNVEFDFNQLLEQINQMGKDVEKVEKKATTKACKVVKEAIIKNLGRSNITDERYTHMADDIKITALKTMDNGDVVRIIKGGKKTGWKWNILEQGDSKTNPNFFMSSSLEETKKEVHEIFNTELKKELNLK